jgi:hypothetical protein
MALRSTLYSEHPRVLVRISDRTGPGLRSGNEFPAFALTPERLALVHRVARQLFQF